MGNVKICSLESELAYLSNLDLSKVIASVVTKYSYHKKLVEIASIQYKRYLYLIKKYGSKYRLPPSVDIDEIWHAHILFTEKYAFDCKKIFGHFVHHRPSDHSQMQNSIKSFADTKKLYKEEFSIGLVPVFPDTLFRRAIHLTASSIDKNLYARNVIIELALGKPKYFTNDFLALQG